jgi:hypothetical protein
MIATTDTMLAESALSIAARRSSGRQWRAFIDALAVALPAEVGDEATRFILARTGEQIAAANPLGPSSTVQGLGDALNDALEHMDWGQIELRESERALDLVLVGYPLFETADGRALFAATVESVFDAWLKSQAGHDDLAVHLVRSTGGAYPALIYRYEKVR